MDTSQITSETVDLLSRITGQKLSQRDITPQVLFLASLVTVLMGVIFVDGTVEDQEKQRLLKILYRFSLPESDVRRLTHLMIKGVKEHQTYKKIQDLLKLTSPLSESEKILLIGFGYEMSAADGEIDLREKQYLGIVAKNLGVKSQHLPIFEIAFTQEGNIEPNALNEVHFLLDSYRFQELDTVFVKAASDMLNALPSKPEIQITQKHTTLSYDELKKFQVYRQELDNYCNLVSQIIHECKDHSFLPSTLIDDITEVYNKIKNQRFRLAVIGEFSQGKSTLLNALLGEEIQPVRAVPCSGTVTVLKYGTQKRVICRYKDGRVEEIAFDQYKIKAAISKEAALGHRSEELAQLNIEEIIFEHPELALCKSGVEIVDSPGLNEHPDRTAITQKILKNADAAIFLTNAMRLLPEKEKELIQYVRCQLNDGRINESAKNLFILVNFIDALDSEEDFQDVKQRLENFVINENLLSKEGAKRIHFISAKAALKSIMNNTNDDYFTMFSTFTKSLENFLTSERGNIKMTRLVNDIDSVIIKSLDGIYIAEQSLDGKIILSESEKYKIIEQIGEASGREVKIRLITNSLLDDVIEEANQSWNDWIDSLTDKLAEKAEKWKSEHSSIFSRDLLVADYTYQFNKDISSELDSWIENELKINILQKYLESLEEYIQEEIKSLEYDFVALNQTINKQHSPNWTFPNYFNFNEGADILGNVGLAGLGAAVLVPAFIFAGPILAIIGGLIGGGLIGTGIGGFLGIDSAIRAKVFETGIQQFVDSLDGVFEKINEIIGTTFEERVKQTEVTIMNIISFYEVLIEQQEKAHQETLEQREIEKAFINQKRQELEQVQKALQTIINKSTTL
jgi:uncharacterized tellurite resistance protein B-like protein/GTPase SAR1 family protein